MRRMIFTTLLAAGVTAVPVGASAAIRITEFMYQGASNGNREFVELTNIGGGAIDISGWTYNDNNASDPVSFGNSFGTVAANESIILTELTAAAFRTYWGLDPAIRIFSIGGNSNLSANDTINIYSSATQNASTLVDSAGIAGSTPGISRNRQVGSPGTPYVNSAVGDSYGSAFAPNTPSDLGNPGRFPAVVAAVPEPATWAMMIVGLGLAGGAARRRKPVTALAAA